MISIFKETLQNSTYPANRKWTLKKQELKNGEGIIIEGEDLFGSII
jgi:hypothetical protein